MLHVPEKIDVIILGGGIAGCLSALKIAKAGMPVLILDKREELLLGASNITPGRMGLGFHYEHLETAIAYLHSTINFVKEFPNFCIGKDNPGSYLQRGRYFIVKNSLFDKEKILSTYRAIKEEYKRLVQLDGLNKVFGEPEDFFRILDPKEYENDVDMSIVEIGIETAECLLDWPSFRSELIKLLEKNENISIVTNCEVDTISRNFISNKYLIKSNFRKNSNTTTVIKFEAEFVVNATWEYVEEITKKAGLTDGLPKDKRTNRLKVLAEVKLPAKLQHKNSMFFCMGPHCMFSNMGNGVGLVSYAPSTNVASSSGLYIPPRFKPFTTTNRSEAEEQAVREEIEDNKFGEKIIAGTAKYIPAMKEADLIGLRFGVVKTQGEVDIFDHASRFHMRNYSGVEEITLGWINNSAMKLLYGLDNANLVLSIIIEQKEIIAGLAGKVETSFSQSGIKSASIQQTIVASLRYHFFRSELTSKTIEELKETADKKIVLNEAIIDSNLCTGIEQLTI